jgi:hypothetical protein
MSGESNGQVSSTKSPTLVLITAGFVLICVAIGPVCLVIHWILGHRWIIQSTPRAWTFGGVAAVALFVPFVPAYLWLTWSRTAPFPWRQIGGMAGWVLIGGLYVGDVAIDVLNRTSAAIPQFVQFEVVHLQKGAVDIRALGRAYDGIKFRCSDSVWEAHRNPATHSASGLLYRGKLGLYWAEFPDK